MSSKNLHDALQLQKEFGGIISDCAELKINLDHASLVHITFTIEGLSPEVARPLHDMFLSMFWNYANWITRTEGKLEQVCFTHEAPEYRSDYLRIFGIEPKFKQSECKLVFDKKYLDEPLYQADEALNSLMREQTETLFKKSKSYSSYYSAVAYQLRQLMRKQKATLTLVAQKLNMSERTLSRKLKEEGYTFKSVLLSVRESLALEYLRQNNLSVNEIANKLGYLDYSSFSNAFRSWTGCSPSEYRDRHNQPAKAS